MCRIASLFLLQKLKGSMSGDARDFKNMETRALLKFFSTRHGAEEILRHSEKKTLGKHAPSHATVKN